MSELCGILRFVRTVAKFIQDFCTIALVHLGCEDEVTVKAARFGAAPHSKEEGNG